MLKVSFEKPKLEVVDEVKDLFRKKKEKEGVIKLWTHKERVVVAIFLILSILFSIYFWYKGSGKLPKLDLEGLGVNQRVILEK